MAPEDKLDVEELPEIAKLMNLQPVAGLKGYSCTPATCNPRCALDIIDGLLRSSSAVRAEELDALLDLRWLLRHRQDAEAALVKFCALHRAMEERHYLVFYRLRRWLENQVEAIIRLRRGEPERTTPLKLERYRLEAVRLQCLEAARQGREPLLCPRVEFVFRCSSRAALGESAATALESTA